MQLLFLSNLYPPHDMGGFEQWCQEVAVRLQQRGHTVQILTSRYGLDHSQPAEQDVIRTLHLQANVHHYRPLDFLRRARQEWSNEQELRRVIEQFDPNLVVVWGMWNLSRNVAYWVEQRMPGRVAYYIASYWPIDTDIHVEYWQLPARHLPAELLKRPLRRLALWQLRKEGYPPSLRFEHAMCCSQYVRDTLVDTGKLPASAGVIYGGIDPEPLLRNPSTSKEARDCPLRLLYFGGLLPHKGVHTAIEAMGLLKQRGLAKRVELTVLGGGHPDYEARLRAMVAQLGIGDQVHFAGRLPRDEIPARLGCFDVFLFTSIWAEPFGRTIVEAMASGLIVIGSDVGGSREIFGHYTDRLLFQPEDSQELAERIMCVLDDPAWRQSLAQTGRQMVLERFTLNRMVTEIEQWLEAIAE